MGETSTAVPRRLRRAWWAAPLALVAATTTLSACEPPPPLGVTARVQSGVLTVEGTADAESITLRLRPGSPAILEVDVGGDGHPEYAVNRSSFTAIAVHALGGADRLSVNQSWGVFTTTEVTTLDGGDGDDQLIGGDGAEWLIGGKGSDTVRPRKGNDTVTGAPGNEVVEWRVGDGDDEINCGAGEDRLVMVGADADERLELSNQGGWVRIDREAGPLPGGPFSTNVVRGMGVETLDLRMAAGVDSVRVGSLSGTHAARIDVDLAATSGAPDASADEVVVEGSGWVSPTATGAQLTEGTAVDVVTTRGAGAPDRFVVVGPQITAFGAGGADAVSVQADGSDTVVEGIIPSMDLVLEGTTNLRLIPLGGADSIDVGDLSGTSLTSLLLDLKASADEGSSLPDASADQVTLEGTSGDDTIAVNANSSAVQVAALARAVTLGSTTTLDHLTVNGGAGNDSITVAPAVGSLIQTTAVP